ncbi:MAG: hypothetical protein ACOXZ6_11025 [Syntrophomonadaceae bacterium]|jgi:hypothetical protein
MRKFLVLVVALMLMSSLVVGCGGDAGSSENGSSPAQTEGKSQESKSMSIDKIRQATVDAGYEVTDDYMDAFMDDVTGGFSVRITADEQDIIYSVLECGSEEAVIKNSQTINEAGYNIAISNGKILSFYGVDEQDGTGKDLLISIVEGNPIPNPNK